MKLRIVSVFALIFLGWLTVTATGCFIKRAPNSGPESDMGIVGDFVPPPRPEMITHKVAGSGKGDTFTVTLEWTGPEVQPWTINRWTVMRDRTDQTQSMLVIEDQTFEVKPNEKRTVQVKAIPITAGKPPARHLIVDYEGMPVYVLTTEIVEPALQSVIDGVGRVEGATTEMMSLVKFVGDSLEYAPGDRDKVEPYLEIIVWDLNADPPQPYIEKAVIEAALVAAVAGGITANEYATFLQTKVPGLKTKDALKEIKRLRNRVNALLNYSGVAVSFGR